MCKVSESMIEVCRDSRAKWCTGERKREWLGASRSKQKGAETSVGLGIFRP